ncbi:hypothetical protein [Novosphingobium endophyticum]|nr:hypothetical protein [Novosphingobium endophyticum]
MTNVHLAPLTGRPQGMLGGSRLGYSGEQKPATLTEAEPLDELMPWITAG